MTGDVVPDVGMPGRDLQRDPLAGAADQDGYRTRWLRLADNAARLDVLTVVSDLGLVAPHALEEIDGLFELNQALARVEKRHAEVGELPRHPATAQAGDYATTGDVVHRCDHLAEVRRVAHAGRCHQGAEFDTLGDGRRGGDHGPGLEDGQLR